MSKLQWSANAFARRMQMSDRDLWLIVEGRDHDRPHYSAMMESLPSTRGRTFSVRLAEQIRLEDISAGGKTHTLALHEHLQAAGDLVQANRERKVRAVFMVDRDRDDFTGSMSDSAHIMYTSGSDVETDILLNSDLWRAIRVAYGLDPELTDRIRRRVSDPAHALTALWRDWLHLGLIALHCKQQRHAPWGRESIVNDPPFGAVRQEVVVSIVRSIHGSAAEECLEADEMAAQFVSQRRQLLLKGRWIARYIQYLVAVHLDEEVIRKVNAYNVIDAALQLVDYSASWTSGYDRRFAAVLSA